MAGKLVLAALTVALISASSSADARRSRPRDVERWAVVTSQEIAVTQDGVATIDLTKVKGSFKAVRLQARRQEIQITGLQIVYASGAPHVHTTSFKLSSGERTKPINQSNDERFIDQVIVNFKGSDSARQKVVLDVYGLQSPEGRNASRAAPPVASVAREPASPASQVSTSAITPAVLKVDPSMIVDGRDVMFGQQNVGFGVDRDTIPVGPEVGKFDHIRLRVLEQDIYITELEIRYVGGKTQIVPVNASIGANKRSSWIRVDGKEFIKEIQLVYKPRPGFKGQARVEVVGQFAAGWLTPGGEGRRYNEGWVLLGSETAGSLGFDKDVVSVGQNEGGFTRLRLNVRGRSITLREIRVVHVSGPDEVITMRDRLDPGQVAGPWSLESGRPPIKEIVATYRTRLLFGSGQGTGVVEFWAQH